MIEIASLDIEMNGFQVYKLATHDELTLGMEYINGLSYTGGIRVMPHITNIKSIQKGLFIITQICLSHNLSIITTQGGLHNFNSGNEVFVDTPSATNKHYDTRLIRDNELHSSVVFTDAPRRGLSNNWIAFDYSIIFETWFQYVNCADERIRPLLKFT